MKIKILNFQLTNKPTFIIGCFGLLISSFLIPKIFDNYFAITPLPPDERGFLWGIFIIFFLFSISLIYFNSSQLEKIALIFFGFLLLILSELLVRFVINFVPEWREEASFNSRVAYPSLWQYRPHPFLQFVSNSHKNDTSEIFNLRGFPGEELPMKKPPNVIRIVCIGGSTTQTGYPKEMEKFLNTQKTNNSYRFEVLNFGLAGYTSIHAVINFIINAIDFSPDYVVVHSGWNEHTAKSTLTNFRTDYSHSYKEFNPNPPIDIPLIKISVIYRELKDLINPYDEFKYFSRSIKQPVALPLLKYPGSNYLETYWRNIRTIIDVARGRNIVPVMTTQPHATDPKIPYFEQGKSIDITNAVLRKEIAKLEEDIILVDIDKELTGKRNDIFSDVGHMTKEGIKLKAEIIGTAIYKHFLKTKSL